MRLCGRTWHADAKSTGSRAKKREKIIGGRVNTIAVNVRLAVVSARLIAPASLRPPRLHPQEEGWSPLLYADFNANEECVLALMTESPEQLFGLLEKMENAQDKVCTPFSPCHVERHCPAEAPSFKCCVCLPTHWIDYRRSQATSSTISCGRLFLVNTRHFVRPSLSAARVPKITVLFQIPFTALATTESFYRFINDFISSNLHLLDSSLSFLADYKGEQIVSSPVCRWLHRRLLIVPPVTHPPGLLNFENRLKWFQKQVNAIREREWQAFGYLKLSVNRPDVFESLNRSVHQFNHHGLQGPESMRGLLQVTFWREPGIGTGPMREFFSLLGAHMMPPFHNILRNTDHGSVVLKSHLYSRECDPHGKHYDIKAVYEASKLGAFLNLTTLGVALGLALLNEATIDLPLPPFIFELLVDPEAVPRFPDDLEAMDGKLVSDLKALRDGKAEVCPCQGGWA